MLSHWLGRLPALVWQPQICLAIGDKSVRSHVTFFILLKALILRPLAIRESEYLWIIELEAGKLETQLFLHSSSEAQRTAEREKWKFILHSSSVCKPVRTAADYSVMRGDRGPGPSSNILAFLLQKVLSSFIETYTCVYVCIRVQSTSYTHTHIHTGTHIHTQQSHPTPKVVY